MIITISGELGSGKSTIAKLLAEKLNYTYVSTGRMMRDMAAARGITITEMNKLCETDKSIDAEIDSTFMKLEKDGKDYVVDSRLGFFFLPKSFKIMLKISTDKAANRVFNDKSRVEELNYKTPEEAFLSLIERRQMEKERYIKLYGVNIEEDSYFDYILDTGDKTVQEVLSTVLEKIFAYLSVKSMKDVEK